MRLQNNWWVILTVVGVVACQSARALVVSGQSDIPTLIDFSEVEACTVNPVIDAGGNWVAPFEKMETIGTT